MKKVDTSKWREFIIGDLFDIHPTKAYKKINIDLLMKAVRTQLL